MPNENQIKNFYVFPSSSSRKLFNIEQFGKKILLTKLVEYVCQNQTGSDTATNALRILSEFNENNPTQMQKHSLQLLVRNSIIHNCMSTQNLGRLSF